MNKVIAFRPKAELDAAGNMAAFIESCQNQLTVFGQHLPFQENSWDVTSFIVQKGLGNKRIGFVFSSLASADTNSPVPMQEPFLSFAKAYMRYMHGVRPVIGFGPRLTALRALEAGLLETDDIPNPVLINTHVLNRAAQLIEERYTDGAAYRMGGQLEMIASFLSEHSLIATPTRWRNPLKRPADTIRVGKAFDERRQSKMPSEAALDALPKVFRLAKEPCDVIVSSVAAILCSAPSRISEVLMLPERCEVRQKNGKDGRESYGLRWWPAKGANPMIKWVVPSMADIVQEAIEKIRVITENARQVARWYEKHPGEIYLEDHLEYLRSREWLSMKELELMLGFVSKGAAVTWCKSNGLQVITERRAWKVRFIDVQKTLMAMLPPRFPVLDEQTGLKYGDALFITRTNEFHPQRATYPCMIEPVLVNQIYSGLGGRATHGFASIFSRFGFAEPDGSPIKITTHQFRHYLNTIAQAGGMSQLDIAKWSGRKDIRQNAAYDHVTPEQMLEKIRGAVGDDSQMFGPLAKIPKKALISRDAFARLRIPTAHTTEIGYCVHDYTMSPCQLHRDCIHCEDMVCVKGDEEKTRRLRQNLEEAQALLKKAEAAVEEGYAGGDRWLAHHQLTVERLTQLCAIMDDPNVPVGAVIQLAPPSTLEMIAHNAPVIATTEDPSMDMLADMMRSMES